MLLNLDFPKNVWVTSLTNQILQPNAIALGNFDGIHKGHQEVFQPILKASKTVACPVGGNPQTNSRIYKTVVSFSPHPEEFFTGQQKKLLTPLAEKIRYLEQLAIDQLILLPFDRELATLSPEDFVKELLIKQLGVHLISIGEDFRFGHQRAGNAELLRSLAQDYGIEVQIARLKNHQDIRISSSQIRQALAEGEIEQANAMLGREYTIVGKVIKGQQLGQKLGFPTANLEISPVKFLPKQGVYLVRVEQINQVNTSHWGLMNIGYRPTVNGKNLTVETHLLDWSGDLYNQTLAVSLIKFLRPEQKFDSLSALTAQISADIQTARKLNFDYLS